MNKERNLGCEGNQDSNFAQNQTKILKLKEQLYRQNSKYLCRHPEVSIAHTFVHTNTYVHTYVFSYVPFTSNT